MYSVAPITLLYTALTYFYELANIASSPDHVMTDVIDQGLNLFGTAEGILGLNGVTSNHGQFPMAFTNSGWVKGTAHRSRDGERYYFFKGIPYATANRFEPPVPHKGWEGVWDARNFRSECLQISIITGAIDGSETCHYLNIATRKVFSKEDAPSKGLRPVIVWIHGGFFFFGGSNLYLPKYWMDEDVVIVSLNYRLGSFGFLNTGDGVVPGNAGLQDQVAALKWIQDNIKFFNGDPRRVTLFGESAGGASAHFLMMSPSARGLFSRVVSTSATGLSHWVFTENPAEQAKQFGRSIGCPTNTTMKMVQCLKDLPAATLALHHAKFFGDQASGVRHYFTPTVDSGPRTPTTVLNAHPLELLKSGKLTKVPFMTGVMSGEGCINLISILRSSRVRREINSRWYHHAPVFFDYVNNTNKDAISQSLKRFYLSGRDISETTAKDAVRMFSDRGFYLDNHDSAVLNSRHTNTYLFYWSYMGRFSLGRTLLSESLINASGIPSNDLTYLIGTGREWILSQLLNAKQDSPFGACHADDLPILFNIPALRPEIKRSDVDYKFSKDVIRLFVSFAETGVPNAGDNVNWTTVMDSNPTLDPNRPLQRLRLDSKFEMIDEPFYERLGFWKNLSLSYV